jgi:DNA-binding HxlR family transcriptional regulator
LTHSRKVDIIIDGKKITAKAEKIELKIDGLKVFSTRDQHVADKHDIKDLQWPSIKSLLKTADAAFSHSDRFRIVKSLGESPKSFTEIKEFLKTTSATTNFHLKRLANGMIVYKDENGRYALTLLGELVLSYFSDFFEEAKDLQKELSS